MQAPIFDSAVRQIAVASITGYQKYISPKKGFSCAHRVLYGGESCSQYIKGAIAQRGLSQGLKAARHRFAACKNANKILKARYNSQSNHENPNSQDNDRAKSEKETSRRNSKYQNDCGDAASDCSSADCSGMDCSGVDCSGMDCSGVDCSGMDCSGADCSGMDCCDADCGSCGSS
ncbi:membrane protein insertion efficiency factor YidD [Kamptonema animale CS-326]|jgi:putative component of membrane protein insertase Oxa1/YidC/SpoIIIJ protein YidD|uniref:membrane protein insertion efficiency factor YidD n=1 Tax=Kamptonema animale TaxID=92934 RepID=UPI00232D1734|nr:membrane protein insertion efficiency factor YidD [Kamptonema animale]MDB9514906.1 membrane protein insertion efficiency factor YidD [Kamptonema animale CS-326]